MALDERRPAQVPDNAEAPMSGVAPNKLQPYYEEGVSLTDLCIVLIRRRVLIGAVVVIALLSGFVFVLWPRPEAQQQYEFSITIEVGQRPGEAGLIDSSETVLAKLQAAYIPVSQMEFGNRAEAGTLLAPDVQSRMQGALVVLKTKGSLQNAALHTELLEAITQRLISDHRRVIDPYRISLSTELELARRQLESLKDPGTWLFDTAKLEERRLGRAREQAEQELRISSLEERLRGFRETRVLLPPTARAVPLSVNSESSVKILVMAGLMGLALGILAAFGAEFGVTARKAISEQGLG